MNSDNNEETRNPGKKKSVVFIPIIAGLVISALIVLLIAFFIGKSARENRIDDGEYKYIHSVTFPVYRQTGDADSIQIEFVRNANDTGLEVTVNSFYSWAMGSALSYQSCIMRSGDSLMVCYGNKIKFIENVLYQYPYGDALCITQDGSKIAVIDNDFRLTVYDCRTWKTYHVADEVTYPGLVWASDGSCMAYSQVKDGMTVSYIYKDGESVKLGEKCVVIGISDSGEYIYCRSDSEEDSYRSTDGLWMMGSLYIIDKQGNRTELSNSFSLSSYVFNSDGSQMRFRDDKGINFVVNGILKERVFDYDTIPQEIISYSVGKVWKGSFGAEILGVTNLTGKYYALKKYERSNLLEFKLCYLNDDFSVTEIADDVLIEDNLYISRDGSTVCYIIEGQLYRVSAKDLSNPEFIASGVTYAQLTADGTGVYYTDESNRLWYRGGDEEAKFIASDVYISSYRGMIMTRDDYLLFMTDADDTYMNSFSATLWSTHDGYEAGKISDDIVGMSVIGDVAFYSRWSAVNHGLDIYASEKGDNFKLVKTGVND